MDLWISIGPNAAVLKSEIVAFEDGGYGCFEITVRSGRAHPISVRSEHAEVARRNVMQAFGVEPVIRTKHDTPKQCFLLKGKIDQATINKELAEVNEIIYRKRNIPVPTQSCESSGKPSQLSTCDCGSPMCKYPNSAHCRRPV